MASEVDTKQSTSSNGVQNDIQLNVHTMPEPIVKKIFNPFTPKFWLLSIGCIILISIVGYVGIFLIPSLGNDKKADKDIVVATTTIPSEEPIQQPTITPQQPVVIMAPTSTVAQPVLTTPTSTSATTTSISELVFGPDEDKDKLTDLEEGLYGGDVTKIDTDGDTYLDGLEIENLYSITSGASATLLDINMVKDYNNNSYRYSIYYPSKWTQTIIDNNDKDVRFVAANGDFVQVLVQDNEQKVSVIDWYKEQTKESDTSQLKQMEVNGLAGITTDDGLITYLSAPSDLSKIYGLIYNIGDKSELSFYTTYKMMLKSFKINHGQP